MGLNRLGRTPTDVPEGSPRRRPRPARVWLALATALVVMGSTGAAFAAAGVARNDEQRSRLELAAAGAQEAAVLQLAVRSQEDLVLSLNAFLIDEPVSQRNFLEWLRSSQSMQRHPELLNLGFVAFVPADRLEATGKRLLADPVFPGPGARTFQVVPPGPRPFYCLTLAGAARTSSPNMPPGLDVCAVNAAAAAFTAIRDSGQGSYFPFPVAGQPSLAVQVPVYRGGVTPATLPARRRGFLGIVGVQLAPKLVLDRALQGHRGTSISMSYRPNAAETGVGPDLTFTSGSMPRHARSISTDLGNGWKVTTYAADPGAGIWSDPRANLLLLGGVVLSLLLAGLIFVLGTGRSRARLLVARKTGEILHLAQYDALTGLPNRALILDRVEQALARARRADSTLGVMFLDLDGFKSINDTFGHAAGDELLRAVAVRLTGALRECDTVGRLGGDEFVVLIEAESMVDGAEPVAERIRAALAAPFELLDAPGHPVHAHVSIGIATGIRESAGELLRDADVALYEAKGAGKDRCVSFAPQMQTAVQDRLELEQDLRESVAALTAGRGEFFLLYQPTFDLATDSITGVEALLRWQHPTRGLVMPETFIPVAEQSGMIVDLGRWVLEQACQQAAFWAGHGRPLAVSVNVSARQFDTGRDFIDTVIDTLATTGLDPGLLTLEITETLLMRDAVTSAQRLRDLKKLGVRIAIDDFGTGYSSLAYLQQFPVDALKIDRSFISGVATNPESPALIHTLIQLGQALGVQTLAEGIEEPAQLQQLQREQCDAGQGYLFARPLTLDDLERLVPGLPTTGDPRLLGIPVPRYSEAAQHAPVR